MKFRSSALCSAAVPFAFLLAMGGSLIPAPAIEVVTAEMAELSGSATLHKTPAKGGPEEPVRVNLGKGGRHASSEVGVAIFRPDLPSEGDYAVSVRWKAPGKNFTAASKRVPVTIHFANGERTLYPSMQVGGEWIFFGVFPFQAGTEGFVKVTDAGTVGVISVESVQFEPVKIDRASKPRALPVMSGSDDDFDKVRIRFAEFSTISPETDLEDADIDEKALTEDFQASMAWQTMSKDPDSPRLFYDIREPKNNEGNNDSWQNIKRLHAMARAYVSSSSKYGFGQKMQGNPELLKDILAGLNWVDRFSFNANTENKAGAVWYANEIGSPTALAETLMFIAPHVSKDQLARHEAAMENMSSMPTKNYKDSFTSTGMNRVNLAYMHALRGVLKKDPTELQDAVSALDDPLSYVNPALASSSKQGNKPDKKFKGPRKKEEASSSEENAESEEEETGEASAAEEGGGKKSSKAMRDGLYEDGTFIQHGHLFYNGGYGINQFRSLAKIIGLLRGTAFEVKNPNVSVIPGFVYNGLETTMAFGDEFPRGIGRAWGMRRAQNQVPGYGVMETVAMLVPCVGPEDAANFKGMLKEWMQQDHYGKRYSFDNYRLSLQTMELLKQIEKDPKISARSRPVQSHVFSAGDMVVHHRPKFSAFTSMSSDRIATHENIWDTNRRGWYQGDGLTLLYAGDNTLYNEDYRALVNAYRLPGTTVDTQPRDESISTSGANKGTLSTSPWAGGVELGRRAVVASMELHAHQSSLRARKSWFYFGDQIVCLGSGITSTDERTIETTIENFKLNATGQNAFLVNGKTEPTTLGWNATLTGVQWAHLEGSAPGTGVGWYFPKSASLKAQRLSRTGSWNDVYAKEDKDQITRNFFELWLDHGMNPADATYEYVILPASSPDSVKAFSEKPHLDILENSSTAQAVRADDLLGVTFWSSGSSAGLTVSAPCAILIQESKQEIRLAVSDPARSTGTVNVTTGLAVGEPILPSDKVRVVASNPLTLEVDLKNSFGESLEVVFKKP